MRANLAGTLLVVGVRGGLKLKYVSRKRNPLSEDRGPDGLHADTKMKRTTRYLLPAALLLCAQALNFTPAHAQDKPGTPCSRPCFFLAREPCLPSADTLPRSH